jgi:hypothetical protein
MAMPRTIEVGDIKMPSRQINVGLNILDVPKGIGRNNRNKCWQVKIVRKGEVVLSGQFTDAQYGNAQKSLQKAIEFLADSKLVEAPKTLKLTTRLSLFWGCSGANVLGLSANLYNEHIGRTHTTYLISQHKIGSGKIDGLQEKLVGVFIRQWAQVNNASMSDLPSWKHIKIVAQVGDIMDSQEWKDFMNLGAELAAQKEADQRESKETK